MISMEKIQEQNEKLSKDLENIKNQIEILELKNIRLN